MRASLVVTAVAAVRTVVYAKPMNRWPTSEHLAQAPEDATSLPTNLPAQCPTVVDTRPHAESVKRPADEGPASVDHSDLQLMEGRLKMMNETLRLFEEVMNSKRRGEVESFLAIYEAEYDALTKANSESKNGRGHGVISEHFKSLSEKWCALQNALKEELYGRDPQPSPSIAELVQRLKGLRERAQASWDIPPHGSPPPSTPKQFPSWDEFIETLPEQSGVKPPGRMSLAAEQAWKEISTIFRAFYDMSVSRAELITDSRLEEAESLIAEVRKTYIEFKPKIGGRDTEAIPSIVKRLEALEEKLDGFNEILNSDRDIPNGRPHLARRHSEHKRGLPGSDAAGTRLRHSKRSSDDEAPQSPQDGKSQADEEVEPPSPMHRSSLFLSWEDLIGAGGSRVDDESGEDRQQEKAASEEREKAYKSLYERISSSEFLQSGNSEEHRLEASDTESAEDSDMESSEDSGIESADDADMEFDAEAARPQHSKRAVHDELAMDLSEHPRKDTPTDGKENYAPMDEEKKKALGSIYSKSRASRQIGGDSEHPRQNNPTDGKENDAPMDEEKKKALGSIYSKPRASRNIGRDSAARSGHAAGHRRGASGAAARSRGGLARRSDEESDGESEIPRKKQRTHEDSPLGDGNRAVHDDTTPGLGGGKTQEEIEAELEDALMETPPPKKVEPSVDGHGDGHDDRAENKLKQSPAGQDDAEQPGPGQHAVARRFIHGGDGAEKADAAPAPGADSPTEPQGDSTVSPPQHTSSALHDHDELHEPLPESEEVYVDFRRPQADQTPAADASRPTEQGTAGESGAEDENVVSSTSPGTDGRIKYTFFGSIPFPTGGERVG